MEPRNSIITVLLLCSLILGAIAPTASAGSGQNGCARSGCHGSDYYQYINILPDHEKSSIPENLEKNESFLMPFVIENECSHTEKKYSAFDWVEFTLTFDSDSIKASRDVIRSGELLPGTRTYYVTLTCERVEPVIVTVDAVGYNSHEKVRSYDTFTFSINAVIELSSYFMEPSVPNHTIELVPNEAIDRVDINVSSGLQGRTNITPMNLTGLSEGVPSNVFIQILDPTAEGMINFTWREGNRTGTVVLTVAIPPDLSTDVDSEVYVLVARITGILSFILLLTSTLLCLNVKKWRKFTIRKLGKRRLRLHCYVSYAIVAVSLVHLIVLLAGGKYSSSFEYGILMSGSNGIYYNLGHVSLIVMVLLGLTGIYKKRMMKYFKARGYIPYATWRLLHLLLTVLALIFVIVHMVKIGTDFSWIG